MGLPWCWGLGHAKHVLYHYAQLSSSFKKMTFSGCSKSPLMSSKCSNDVIRAVSFLYNVHTCHLTLTLSRASCPSNPALRILTWLPKSTPAPATQVAWSRLRTTVTSGGQGKVSRWLVRMPGGVARQRTWQCIRQMTLYCQRYGNRLAQDSEVNGNRTKDGGWQRQEGLKSNSGERLPRGPRLGRSQGRSRARRAQGDSAGDCWWEGTAAACMSNRTAEMRIQTTQALTSAEGLSNPEPGWSTCPVPVPRSVIHASHVHRARAVSRCW